jgi:hypothetical protein
MSGEQRLADSHVLRPSADGLDILHVTELLELAANFVIVDRLTRWRTSEGDLEAALQLLLERKVRINPTSSTLRTWFLSRSPPFA